mgnify:CR=1 FL=1
MSEPPVLVDVRNGIATITLNRPKSLNAINPEMAVRLQAAYVRVREYVCARYLPTHLIGGTGDDLARTTWLSCWFDDEPALASRCGVVSCSDPAIRVAILAARGRAFCAGADLKRLITLINGDRQPSDDWDRAYLRTSPDPFMRTFDIKKVGWWAVVCAV